MASNYRRVVPANNLCVDCNRLMEVLERNGDMVVKCPVDRTCQNVLDDGDWEDAPRYFRLPVAIAIKE